MGDARISPLDPLFYCHHANIDRIWSEWQREQADNGNTSNINPDLNSEDTKMYPWWPEYSELKLEKLKNWAINM